MVQENRGVVGKKSEEVGSLDRAVCPWCSQELDSDNPIHRFLSTLEDGWELNPDCPKYKATIRMRGGPNRDFGVCPYCRQKLDNVNPHHRFIATMNKAVCGVIPVPRGFEGLRAELEEMRRREEYT